MAWEEVARGSPFQLVGGLGEYDSQFPEGSRGVLQINSLTIISPSIASGLESAAVAAGIPDVHVEASGKSLFVYFRKTYFWLPLIVALVLVLAIVIVLWILFRIAPVATTALVLVGVAAAVFVGVLVLKGEIRRPS